MTNTKNTFRQGRLGALALAVVAVACGGNYSNEDVDFQLAAPEAEDLAARQPIQQALVAADAAEYLLATHKAIAIFNVILDQLTGLVDHVRAYPPTSREGETRIWGPFPHEQDPRWELRMRMTRGRDDKTSVGYRFAYSFEFHRVGAPDAWKRLMSGSFTPGAGARRGSGDLELVVGPARAAGYPVRDFEGREALRVRYQRASFPISIELHLENVAGNESPGSTYAYSEAADGAGAMTFVNRGNGDPRVNAFAIQSRWRADGLGRADVHPVDAGPVLDRLVGIDCWAGDGRATFVRRDWAPAQSRGDANTCVLGPP